MLEEAKKKLLENDLEPDLENYLFKHLENKNDFEESVNRLIAGEPIQYIIGNVNFCGYKINVNKNVLIPRFETEDLVSRTINYIKQYFNKQITVLDIGTGSGCIAITLNKKLDCLVHGIDISKDALLVAKENALLNNADINFYNSDIFQNVKDKFDVIISNPPYISNNEEVMDIVKNNEPHLALYADNDGLAYYERILKDIKQYLKEQYFIALEIGSSQGSKLIELKKQYLKDANIWIEKDLSDRDRFLFITNIM